MTCRWYKPKTKRSWGKTAILSLNPSVPLHCLHWPTLADPQTSPERLEISITDASPLSPLCPIRYGLLVECLILTVALGCFVEARVGEALPASVFVVVFDPKLEIVTRMLLIFRRICFVEWSCQCLFH